MNHIYVKLYSWKARCTNRIAEMLQSINKEPIHFVLW